MQASKRNILTFLSHGLAVLALLLFIAPIDAAHAEPHSEPSLELPHAHSASDKHDDHPTFDDILEHCEPGPDCSNTYAFFNSQGVVLASADYSRLPSDFERIFLEQSIPNDSPPPRRVS